MPDARKNDVVLNENHKSVTGLNLNSGLTVCFTLNNLSDGFSDSGRGIFGENRARIVSVSSIVVSRSGK